MWTFWKKHHLTCSGRFPLWAQKRSNRPANCRFNWNGFRYSTTQPRHHHFYTFNDLFHSIFSALPVPFQCRFSAVSACHPLFSFARFQSSCIPLVNLNSALILHNHSARFQSSFRAVLEQFHSTGWCQVWIFSLWLISEQF